ncbi:MAG: carboxylating nicotinate-nucleotide diphosphorylase [Acidimicrobiia bacterium]
MNNHESHSQLITLAMQEDLSSRGDVTSQATIDNDKTGEFIIRCRQRGVLSGIDVATETMHSFDPKIEIIWKKHDGEVCEVSEDIGVIRGKLRSLLAAERTTLNFLQHLSGIATLTRIYVDELAKIHSTSIIRDTRKTLPGYRTLEKKAVVDGGGHNHRTGLYDAFLIKDNHLSGTTLSGAISACRKFDPTLPLEVEVDSLDQLMQVIDHRPDLVLLDNFKPQEVLEAIKRAPMIDFEISGGVNIYNLAEYGKTNVKYIAIGSLTHSAPSLDIGFDLP